MSGSIIQENNSIVSKKSKITKIGKSKISFTEVVIEDRSNSSINYKPSFKGVLIKEYVRPEILVPSKEASRIIKVSEIRDQDLLDLGLNTKGAMVANKSTEDQSSFVIVALGPKVDLDEFKVGDRVLLRHAAQPIGIEVDGVIYGQIHEYEIAGKMFS
jgi:hypothetical protein